MGATDNNSTTIPRIMVFKPTLEEMKDFSKYLEYMESQGANKAGLAKIIPPKEYVPRKRGYDDIDVAINSPIQQVVTGGQGLYQQYNIQKRSMSIKDFKKMAESSKYMTPIHDDYEELERKYWKNVTFNPAIYGADVSGSLTDADCKEFNINNLNTILDMINESYGIKIMGVNTAYLYFGMWKTTFAWHTEDMDLYSINYLHFGAPKSWYCVPPEHGKRLERLANGFFPQSYKTCPAFLRHKMTLISPQVLKKYSIPYNKITQESGEFMITFPYAYHAGYNHGYNCAESTNFALPRWVEFGKRALRCLCRPDAVKISMEAFVKKFQPDRYDLWLQGKDFGPDPKDPGHLCYAPAPSSYELNVMSKFSGKHKRHPPHKKDYSSDTEEYASDDDCSELANMFTPPTKAARKMFESDNGTTDLLQMTSNAPSIAAISPDVISSMPKPPSIEDTILRLHKNLKSSKEEKTEKKKRKKRSNGTEIPPHLLNHSYAKPNQDTCVSSCTQPNTNHLNTDYFAHLSSVLNFVDCDPLQSQNKLKEVINASNPESPFPQFSNSMSKSESSAHSQPFQFNNDYKNFPLDDKVFHKQSFATPLTDNYLVKSEVNSRIGQQIGVNEVHGMECQMVPPLIIPYYQYSVDNMSPPSQPPLLNPQDLALSNNFGIDGKLNSNLFSNGCHQLINGSNSGLKMVEASTSTEDLDPLNGVNHMDNNSNHSIPANNSSLVLEELSKKTLQYTPPTFGPSPEGFADEIKFNLYMSTIKPHCAVCNILRPFELNQIMNISELDSWSPPKSSSILIPSIAFTSKVKDESTLLDSRETSPLVVCMDCRVCVHSVCYGASNILFDGSESNWRCDRCEMKDYFAICCLCPLRGGPLKETTKKKWVHLSCALLVPDVQFVNGIAKRPIDLTDLKPFRKSEKMRCVYCRKNNPENKMVDYLTGYCIQCTSSNSCRTSFHVTCGHRHGVIYQAGDWPDPIIVTCFKCSNNSQLKKKQLSNKSLKEVEIGEKVIAKHKNKRFYNAKVIDIMEQVFHHVHFVDNSFTQNIKSCDILNRDCERDPPEIGDPVEVIWNKEQLHGKYTGNHRCKMYSIQFDDGSQTKHRRDDFYLLTDELPKRVQLKMSSATEVQYLLTDDSNSQQ